MAKTIEEALKETEGWTYDTPFVESHETIEIDEQTREVLISQNNNLFGVESDEKAERKYFTCSRYVGDHIDLSELSIRINYRNANNETDVYIVDDVEIMEEGAPGRETEEVVTFSWLLSRKVTRYKGAVQFIICAVRTEGENIKNEWNTTIATGIVLEGLEAEIDVTPDEKDVLTQLINMSTDSANIAKQASEDATVAKDEANKAVLEAQLLKEQLETLIEQAQSVVNSLNETVPEIPITFDPVYDNENIHSGDTVREVVRKAHDIFEELGEAATYDVAGSFEEILEQVEAVPHARLVKELKERGYDLLEGKPSINNVVLEGNKTLEDIGVIKAITDIVSDGAKLKFQVLQSVSELPEAGEPGVIYLAPKEEATLNTPVIENRFLEYMYVVDHYEVIGEVSAQQLVADAELSLESENPVQNKVITQEINDINGNLIDARNYLYHRWIYYHNDTKTTALDQLNNPGKIFGNKYQPYLIMFYDTVGDSPLFGGVHLVIGYMYETDLYGAQFVLSFAYRLKYRSKIDGNWTDWTVVS